MSPRGTPATALALGALLALLAPAAPAAAHARLVAASPRESGLLASSPAAVDLWFSELLDDAFHSIEVSAIADEGRPGGPRSLVTAPAGVDANDRTHLVAPLGRLRPGAYAVEWRVLSRDGHAARGRYEFRILGDRDGAY